MTACTVLHETGWRHRALRHRVEEVAGQVAPVLEETAGLRLPRPTVIRLVTVVDYTAEALCHLYRQALRDARELPLTQEQTSRIRRHLHDAEHRTRCWRHCHAGVILTARGEPHLLLVPTVARGVGEQDEREIRALAHMMALAAQWQASKDGTGELWCLRETLLPQARGVDHLALDAVSQGHAAWARDRVVHALLGRAGSRCGARPYHREQHREPGALAQHRAARDQGEAFVGHIAARAGIEALHAIWHDPVRHAPTHRELAAPEAWLHRRELGLRTGIRGEAA